MERHRRCDYTAFGKGGIRKYPQYKQNKNSIKIKPMRLAENNDYAE